MKIINKIRKKSLEEQKIISVGIAFGVTFFIFVIWLLTVIYGFSGFEGEEKKNNTASPINIFTNSISNVFDGKEVYKAE